MTRPLQRHLKLLLLMTTMLACSMIACLTLMLFKTNFFKLAANIKDNNNVLQLMMIDKDVQLPTVCQNLTCKAAYLRRLHNGRQLPIPPIRHLLWRSELVSAYFAMQLNTWNQIHPDWTVMLWRDEDLLPFVKKHFPRALPRFLELNPYPIMQVDMVRYMLLFKYGGVYADLDYSLSASLDEYRRFYAVVTREPEAHSLQFFGLRWPPRPMANPAFLMSAPGHSFYRYCVEQLQTKPYLKGRPLSFGGPFGLTFMLEHYADSFPIANSPLETVYTPPSFSFHPYEKNRMNTTGSKYLPMRMFMLRKACRLVKPYWAEQLIKYCTDPNNMDPITDKAQPVVAVHDMKKSGAIYDGKGTKLYYEDLKHVRSVFGSKLVMGSDWI